MRTCANLFNAAIFDDLTASRGTVSGELAAAAKLRRAAGSAVAMCFENLEQRVLFSADVLTYHNDNMRDGQNLAETTLTTSNVNVSSFGKLFTFPTDGLVYAQTLLKSAVNVPGLGATNLLLVATEHDSVYAFNADSGSSTPVWRDSFINPAAGVTTVPSADVGVSDISPEIGITGTPVIDPATNTLYVVAKTKEVTNGVTSYVQRIHALDIATGTEKFGGPAVISASVSGTGAGAVNGIVSFDPLKQNQRPALLLSNGVVYIGWASHGDIGPYHGWLVGYTANDLTKTPSVLNLDPNGSDAGIWMSGGGPAVDASGNIYLATGNGTFDASTGGSDYGDSTLRITATPKPTIADYFTPSNQAMLDAVDLDFGSGAPLLLPDQSGPNPHELVVAGKSGTIYVLNRDNLGGFNANGNVVIQEIPNQLKGCFDTPAYFNGQVYFAGSNANGQDVLKAFSITNGLLSTTPISQASAVYGFPGSTPSISANGAQNGIVWTLDNGARGAGPAVLYANLASNVATQLWNSNLSGTRDLPEPAVVFTVPTVVNGRVYVGGTDGVAVYGLLNAGVPFGGTPAAVPGTIEAENYDVGGQGVAFNTPDTFNHGGAYRNDAVGIEPTTDAGGGFDVGWVQTGEWLKYTVNVATSGGYTLGIRVASASSGGTFHVEADGADVTGSITLPNTGGWQNWTTLTKTVSLTAGAHVLRLFVDSSIDTFLGNFNWMSLTPIVGNQPPVVNAGANQTITLPGVANLVGTATDDGLPTNTLATSWTVVSGPGSVTFGNSAALSTTVSFSLAGTYVLALSANDGQLSTTSNTTIFVNPSNAGSTPFSGTPIAVPGTIQAENYDLGGQGVAYSTSDKTNQGGAYRNDGIGIETTTDTGGGFDVGWVHAGEWLKYTVNVANTGNYTLGVRVASNSPGGTFHVESDGVNITGSMKLTSTGGWQIWKTLTKNVSLTAGTHVLRLVIDSSISSDIGNFNWLSLTAAPANQPPVVNAGANQTITLPAPALLSGAATDDGLPNGTLTTTWSVVSGPGTVTFANASAPNTSATFSIAGTYVLALTANDGQLSTTANTTVTVNPAVNNTFSWKKMASLPHGGSDEGQAAVVNGKIYNFGGYINDTYAASLETDVYDPATNTWTQLANMPEKLTHAGAIVDGTTIWLIGGFIGLETAPATTHVWKYDTVANTWTAGPSLPTGMGTGAVTLVGRTIHVISGLTLDASNNPVNTTEHYTWNLDTSTSWGNAAPMPNPRNHVGSVTLNGKIYVVGGQDRLNEVNGGLATVSVYDPATDIWTNVASLPQPVSHEINSTLVYQGKILVVGGETPGGASDPQVLQYDPATNLWSVRTDLQLPAGVKTPVAKIIGTTIYVYGGAAPSPVGNGEFGTLP
ncbi:MAG: carbohydrate-binding protein [Planctomycetota bacterium]|nr:carbohydrate-binding protein [Planctomycetota bacterium]